MLVKATAKGFYGSLHNVGDEFEVPAGTTGSWFASLEPAAAPAVGKAKKAKAFVADAEGDTDAPTDDIAMV